jgi:hypothetical protein
MCVCAGSSTNEFTSCVPPELSGSQDKLFQAFSRPGPDGSRARQDWVHEHAETGKPLAAYKLHGAREYLGGALSPPGRASCLCRSQRWNGPASNIGMVGHNLSAIGVPHRTARSARLSPRITAPTGRPPLGNRHTSHSRVIPSAHPLPFRFCAYPSFLAAGPSWR